MAPERCHGCRGSGVQVKLQQLGPSIIQQIQTMCEECGGKGEYISTKDRCRNCDGKRIDTVKKILEVHIDKGMHDGQKVTLTGEGDMEPGLEEPGDILVVLDEKDHAGFKRLRNDDLVYQMELSLTESLCGFKRLITTLDNRTLVVGTVPGEVVKHGSFKCVYGEGMPHYRNPFEKG